MADIDRLKKMEQKKERLRSSAEERLEKIGTQGGKYAQFDVDSKLEDLRRYKQGGSGQPSFFDSIIRGLTWGNIYLWDRSYEPKFDFSTRQRMSIINYCYDRFSFRAGKVSREVSSKDYIPHNERMKTSSLSVGCG
jgi:hypothetical protein